MNSLIGLQVHSDNHTFTTMSPETQRRGASLRPSGSSSPGSRTQRGNPSIALPHDNTPNGSGKSDKNPSKHRRLSKRQREAAAKKTEADRNAEAAKAAPKPNAAKDNLIPEYRKLYRVMILDLESHKVLYTKQQADQMVNRSEPLDKYVARIRILQKPKMDISTLSLEDLTEEYDLCLDLIYCQYIKLMWCACASKIIMYTYMGVSHGDSGEDAIKAAKIYIDGKKSSKTFRKPFVAWQIADRSAIEQDNNMQSDLKRLNLMLERNGALESRETDLKIPNLLVLENGKYKFNKEAEVYKVVSSNIDTMHTILKDYSTFK